MSTWGADRRADVVILTAIRLEFDAVLLVDAGAVRGSVWEAIDGPSGLPVAFRSFVVDGGRPLRVAVAVAPDMGATAATNTLLPLIEALRPRCIAMCGVCAGRRGKTQLGDVVAAERVYYHDTGKRRPGEIQQDLTTYKLRDDWKAALDGMSSAAPTRFRDEEWFQARPITTSWREARALIALRDSAAEPWVGVDPALDEHGWKKLVESLRERKLLAEAGRELTDAGRSAVESLLFDNMGKLPDLSPSAAFQPFQLHVASMASGSQIIEDEKIWAFVSPAMRKTLALEMEGAALGELAHRQQQYELDAVVMKGVMDFADHGRDDHFKQFAARASAECLLWFLRERVPTQVTAGFDDLLTPGTSPPPSGKPAPSFLLNARHAVVPWHEAGRTEILADLDSWADDPSLDVAVRLLHAEGGVGKTRLAIEWVRRRRGQHDLAGFLIAKPGDHWLERLCGAGPPVLIVIDYAESRPDLVGLLERLAAFAAAPGPRRRVRMLLLARGDGDWWAALPRQSTAVGAILSAAPMKLAPLAVNLAARVAVFADAAAVFAAVQERSPLVRAPIALDDPRFERVLYLHMAALAAVENAAFDAGSLMDVILDHEERFWRSGRQASTIDVSLGRELVAAATLRGGLATKAEAFAICDRLTQSGRTREDDALIELLHNVYERGNEYLPRLEPDLLGEGLVLRVAAPPKGAGSAASDAWIDRVFVPRDEEQALTTGFTVLGRASATNAAAARPWIQRLLGTDLPARAVLALQAAKAVGQRTAFSTLGDLLADALEQHGSAAIADDLDRSGIPYPTVSLQRVAMWRSLTLVDSAPVGDDEYAMSIRARRLGQRGIDLGAAGQREEAVVAAREAVNVVRALATRNPAFHPELADGLSNLGIALSAIGQREEALSITYEAVELRRTLAARDPDAFQLDLAVSLNGLGSRLSALGKREAALVAIREAVELVRRLSAHNVDACQPDLAMSLNNLGAVLSAMGQREEALLATREAVAVRRALALRNPDAFQPELAGSLNNLGNMLSALGQREEALLATREAVAVRRTLALRNPDAFQPDLAMSLNNLGNMLSAVGLREEALAAAREAVETLRTLVSRSADAFEADLATSLNNLGNMLSAVGQLAEALAVTREAVELLRALATRNPDAFQPHLAASLNSFGNRLSALGKHGEALTTMSAAVELRRELAARNPTAFQPDLAMSLNNLGNMLSAMGHHEAALAAAREAVTIRRALSVLSPTAFQPDLAVCLHNLGSRLSALGHHEDALVATREAVGLRRTLAADRPAMFQPDLAGSMRSLGNRLSAVGHHEAALTVTREAVELHRILASRSPDAFNPDLAGSLNSLGNRLSALGQYEAALAASLEAVELLRALATRDSDAFHLDLASSLNNLGIRLSAMGQHEAALAAMIEAVGLRRALATSNPSAFRPALATSLNNLGAALAALRRYEAALTATREAVEILRALATRIPDAFALDLASSLKNLSNMLTAMGQGEAALEAAREAVEIDRTFATRGTNALRREPQD